MLNLQEVYNTFLNESNNDKIHAGRKFILHAKKSNPAITLAECRKIMGYSSPDEKQDLNLNQQFRMNILNPTRNYITKKLFQITDTEIEALWGRSVEEKTEQQRTMQQQVLDKLPNRTRVTRAKTMDYLDEFIA